MLPLIFWLFTIGDSAMYGSYSVMHLQKNTIIDIQLVQVSVKYTRMTVLQVTVTLVDVVVMSQSDCERDNTYIQYRLLMCHDSPCIFFYNTVADRHEYCVEQTMVDNLIMSKCYVLV